MKLQTLLLSAISITSMLLSCTKDNADIVSTSAKIQNKWQIDSLVINQQINGNSNKETRIGDKGDNIEFRSDGRMITYFQDVTDNSSFVVKNDSVIVIGGDSSYIEELTENKFIFFSRASAGGVGFIEIRYYLSR